MSEMAKEARAAMKSKAKRLGTTDPHQKVDASSWTPPEPLNADIKTGLRPLSRRAFKKGGKVMGEHGVAHAGRKPRKSGGLTISPAEYAKAKINRNVKDANEERPGKKHVGGMNRGGEAPQGSPPPRTAWERVKDKLGIGAKSTHTGDSGHPGYSEEDRAALQRKYEEAGGMKKGGRAKKMDGGILAMDPRMGMVQPKRLTFGNALVTPGQKRGGKVGKHPDEAMDKALIKKMVKKEARTGKARGGMSLDGEIQGTRPTGGRRARADGGNMPQTPTPTATTTSTPTLPARAVTPPPAGSYKAQGLTYQRPVSASTPLPTREYSSTTREYTPAENQQRAIARREAMGAKEMARQKAHDARVAFTKKQSAIRDAANEARKGMSEPGTAANAAKLAGLLSDTRVRTPSLGSIKAAKKGGRIKKYSGGGVDEYAYGGMPSRGGNPMHNMGGGNPMQGMGGRNRPLPGANPLTPTYPPMTGGPSVPAPVTGGPLPQYMGAPGYKRGGVANKKKGKTNINIVIAAGKGQGEERMPAPVPPPPGAMPPPNMPPAPPPGDAPPMPPMPPMGGAPGMPPGMPPMPRKAGGRITKTAHSYKDMQAGAGSGEGRLQKTDIAARQREGRKHGGKAYHSFKDLTAGAGSGEGRLQKTDIAAYKRSAKN